MIAIIGCGNANRSDDAVGLEVVRLLLATQAVRSRSDVRVLDAGTDGMAVMFAARGCTSLIVIDSCSTGAEPGAIFEIPGSEVESRHKPSLNLHDFRWDHALHAGRQIYRDDFPKDVTAYLIEARSLELGIGLSPDVREAAQKVVRNIEARIAATPAVSFASVPVS
ncbi:MAG: hydrogenase maturation protease [Hyphomicrobium sp.]